MAKEGIKFLLWGYFRLSENEKKDIIIRRCIDLAYSDATNEGSFNTRALDTARNPFADRDILDAITNWEITDYDIWHKRICDKLVYDYRDVKRKVKNEEPHKPAFTYGNAQKWINMTVKYLYLFRSTLESFDENCSTEFREFYDSRFAAHERSFHVPIDSFIMEAVWPENAREGEENWLPPGAKFTKNNRPFLGKYDSTHYTSWSNFDEESYNSVKNYVRTCVITGGKAPLEWENEEWMRIAKKRKNTEVKVDGSIWCELEAEAKRCQYRIYPSNIPVEYGGDPTCHIREGFIYCKSQNDAKECVKSIVSLIENGYKENSPWSLPLDMKDVSDSIFSGNETFYLYESTKSSFDQNNLRAIKDSIGGSDTVLVSFTLGVEDDFSVAQSLLGEVVPENVSHVFYQATFKSKKERTIDVWYS